ncbi:MAG: hypothetical protein QGH20_02565 [Candidatus Latescibacteria bacterium]|jgi:hypothetical protein|nr:hypothetical protein [Candidatus Latescibacterota bacterium]
MPRRSFEESISEFSKELAELAGDAQSQSAHSAVSNVRDKLTALLENFLSCEACGQPFPSLAQVKWGEIDAKVCTECGISILQGVVPDAAGTRKKARSRKPAKSAQGVEVAESPPSSEGSASEPVAQTASPTNSSGPGGANSKPPVSTPKAVRLPAKPTVSRSAIESGQSDASTAAASKSRSTAPTPSKGRGKNAKTVTVEAEPSAVAKKLGVKIAEVKRVAGLMKELLPAMDLERTVAYVSAEMRNARTKFSEKDVAAIVKALSAAPKPEAAPKK